MRTKTKNPAAILVRTSELSCRGRSPESYGRQFLGLVLQLNAVRIAGGDHHALELEGIGYQGEAVRLGGGEFVAVGL
ncbi:MAG: hypothetical protein CMO80_00515 [Verrucomicrobiales bacterium]|nr:hypothetical protein [Verrucomicrobiales bacterium]